MDLLVEHVSTFVNDVGRDRKFLLAYSGGLDSHVLLHIFASYKIELTVIYVDHGVNAKSTEWGLHCERTCRDLNIKFIQKKLHKTRDLLNLEEKLRQSRYQLFESLLEKNDILLTAHHQNDQAETLLLQLCRGAGLPGLSAMPRIKTLGQGFHARPLLDFTRDDLLRYAQYHQLNWIEDESNANPQFTRNFLRHEVMPILTKRWPTITNTLARVAENCMDAQRLIDLSTQDLLVETQGGETGTLSVKKLLLLDFVEQRHVLRAWISQVKFLLPSQVKMQQILQTILLAREDKTPCVGWGNVEIRRYRDDLFLMEKLGLHDSKQIIPWDMLKPLVIPNIGILKTDSLRTDLKNITVRFRQGGEMLRLPGREHHHQLKKLFQAWGVLPWHRDRIPLVYKDDMLVAVVGYWFDPFSFKNCDQPPILLQSLPT